MSYFANIDYDDLQVHEVLLKDCPRHDAFHSAIMTNAALFKNKVVLDVGAGTGILSAFCAKAGARLVYAIEPSDTAKAALQIIADNGMTPVVKIIQCTVEEFKLPSMAEKVDIIISDFMGYFLMYESIVESVIYARDNFLKPNGIIFPKEASIFVAPCSMPSDDYWNDLHGVRMNKFESLLKQQRCQKAEIMNISPEDLLHEGVPLYTMNLKDVTLEEIRKIRLKDVVATQRAGKYEGFCFWFDIRFPAENRENAVVLSTSPHVPQTYWRQCTIGFPENYCKEVEQNELIAITIVLDRIFGPQRHYNIEVLFASTDHEESLKCICNLPNIKYVV